MSWLKDLYDTYQENLDFVGKYDERGRNPLLPACHLLTKTAICVELDEQSNFIGASAEFLADTVSPCAEQSMARSGPAPKAHGLSDELVYLDPNFHKYISLPKCIDPQKCAIKKCKKCVSNDNLKNRHSIYIQQLKEWCSLDKTTQYHHIIHDYVSRFTLIDDLVKHKLIILDEEGNFQVKGGKKDAAKAIFTALKKSNITKNETAHKIGIRWQIKTKNKVIKTWQDECLQKSWINYILKKSSKTGLCLASGLQCSTSSQSPKYTRHSGDSTMLISGNDENNFTYKGRFEKGKTEQVMSTGLIANQQAHACLKWLLSRQGYNDHNTFSLVAWGIKNTKIKQLLNTDIFQDEEDSTIDTNESFGRIITQQIRGFSKELSAKENDSVVILGIDSSADTLKGRSSIVHYSKHTTSDYLEKLEYWHTNAAWAHGRSVKNKFIGAPSPMRIAEACFEKINKSKWEADPKVTRRTIKAFLPCIINQTPIPRHYLSTILKKVSNRHAYKKADQIRWENSLSIACSLYKHHEFQNNNITYDMNLELKDKPRDYLYGCLLAIADHYEDNVLRKQATAGIAKDAKDAKTKKNTALNDRRPTNAARMMAAFSQKPYTTWLNLHRAVEPYLLKNQTTNHFFQEAVGAVITSFSNDAQYKDNTPLEGTYLLGFYSQREALKPKEKNSTNENNGNN